MQKINSRQAITDGFRANDKTEFPSKYLIDALANSFLDI